MDTSIRRPIFARIKTGDSNLYSSYDEYITDISDNLLKIFNTKQGSAEIALNYGSPDFNSIVHNCPEAITSMETMLVETIIRFEPRLIKPNITGTIDPEYLGSLRFYISAFVDYQNNIRQISYNTIFVGNGKIMIKR